MDPNIPNQQKLPQTPSVPIPEQAPMPLTPPPSPKMTKQNAISLVVIIVFLLAASLIAAGGYLYITQQTQVEEIDVSNQGGY